MRQPRQPVSSSSLSASVLPCQLVSQGKTSLTRHAYGGEARRDIRAQENDLIWNETACPNHNDLGWT